MTDFQKAEFLLQKIYGYDQFRDGQKRIIENVLQGNDTLGIMPTGGGKSICYQIPAQLFQGVTLVVTPLISLMKDQVDALIQYGVAATYLNSTLTETEAAEREQGIISGKYKLVYIAPERLEQKLFNNMIDQVELSLIAIDEAHCLSQWGHDFRPSYLRVVDWIEQLQQRPVVLALTATATEQVQQDLMTYLHIKDEHKVLTHFARENLQFQVKKGIDKKQFIYAFAEARKDDLGIIYAATRKDVEQIAADLRKKKMNVAYYHGGLNEIERTAAQNAFVKAEVNIMVATNAFGMGIDISNIRYVLHYSLPATIEAYYQEAGRAGRDGEESECILLFSPQDVRTQMFLIEQSERLDDRKELEIRKLQQMTAYCHTEQCLQWFILEYFGEQSNKQCEKCSNCTQTGEKVERTEEAQKIFSCIKRMRERFGKTLIAQVLVGSNNQKVRELNLNQLPTYGLMSTWTQKEVAELIDVLTAEQYLQLYGTSFPVLKLTDKAISVLKGEEEVYLLHTVDKVEIQQHDDLFEQLRLARKQLASERNLAPYLIFSDKTLKEMSSVIPLTEKELRMISGVGEKKLEQYGSYFLQILEKYKERKQTNALEVKRQQRGKKAVHYTETVNAYQEGETVLELAKRFNLTEQTIVRHLIRGQESGIKLKLWEKVETSVREQILAVANEIGTEYLRPIKEALPDEISYEDIQFTLSELKFKQKKESATDESNV